MQRTQAIVLFKGEDYKSFLNLIRSRKLIKSNRQITGPVISPQPVLPWYVGKNIQKNSYNFKHNVTSVSFRPQICNIVFMPYFYPLFLFGFFFFFKGSHLVSCYPQEQMNIKNKSEEELVASVQHFW